MSRTAHTHQINCTNLRLASVSPSTRWVVCNEAWPASCCTSRTLPPTSLTLRAARVMKRPASGMAATARHADIAVEMKEPLGDGGRRQRATPFGVDDGPIWRDRVTGELMEIH